MNKNKLGSSFNKQEEILNFLKSDCPEVFSEGKIDCKKLKQTLGEAVDDGNERYGLNWAGKSNCFRVIQGQTTATLKPSKGESVNFDETQNLFIEGDNLEVLKVLQRSYYGKIKMIYIDPPYNTGNDFIYNDDFKIELKSYKEATGIADTNGDTIRTDGLSLNRKDSNGHFHSDWLNMMYPRLFLARNLLRQDGVIFVSIDDNEAHNLKLIMNEIFGEENLVADFVVVRAEGGGLAKQVIKGHDYLLVYARSIEEFTPLKKPRDIRGKIIKKDGVEYWLEEDWLRKEFGKYGTCHYEEIEKYKGIDKKKEIDEGLKTGRYMLAEKKNGMHIVTRLRRIDEDSSKFYSILKHLSANGIRDLEEIDFKGYFDYPKPISLLREIINGVTMHTKNENEIILDFFAGSSTTAEAVMRQNADDGGNRKWICVQIPELCEEESEAYKAGYKTIAEIGKERIRRAGAKIKKENENIDSGFKVLKLDNSNFKIWQGKYEGADDLLSEMREFIDNVQKGSKEEDILFELILKSGLDLSVPVEEKEFGKDKYYSLGGGKLIIYLGKKITKEMAEAFQKEKPQKMICLDGCFQNNDQLKTNISLQMEQEKIDFKVI